MGLLLPKMFSSTDLQVLSVLLIFVSCFLFLYPVLIFFFLMEVSFNAIGRFKDDYCRTKAMGWEVSDKGSSVPK